LKRSGSQAELRTEHNAKTGNNTAVKKAKPSVHAVPSAAGMPEDAMDPMVHGGNQVAEKGKAGGAVMPEEGEEFGGGVEQGAGADTVLQGEYEEEEVNLTPYMCGMVDFIRCQPSRFWRVDNDVSYTECYKQLYPPGRKFPDMTEEEVAAIQAIYDAAYEREEGAVMLREDTKWEAAQGEEELCLGVDGVQEDDADHHDGSSRCSSRCSSSSTSSSASSSSSSASSAASASSCSSCSYTEASEDESSESEDDDAALVEEYDTSSDEESDEDY
jgi:hypothetical protein